MGGRTDEIPCGVPLEASEGRAKGERIPDHLTKVFPEYELLSLFLCWYIQQKKMLTKKHLGRATGRGCVCTKVLMIFYKCLNLNMGKVSETVGKKNNNWLKPPLKPLLHNSFFIIAVKILTF